MNLLLLLILAVRRAQAPGADLKTACEERAQSILRTLASDNSLRHALENGQRGDCIHQPWMDRMRHLGVKQASMWVEYSWKEGKVAFTIRKVFYFDGYYSDSDNPIGGTKLTAIHRSGLERELTETVLARVRKGPFAIHHAGQVDSDTFEANILDDESLPAIDRIQ